MKHTKLPLEFIERMTAMLGAESERFFLSFEQPHTVGLRINPLKINNHSETLQRIMEQFHCKPIPWCSEGYCYDRQTRPGKHPYHAAGLYYIQEPSAMSVVEHLQPEPGDIVLDLAAAPGGKATQIAAKLAGEGLLIANEIHPARAKVLSENIERWGAANCIVTNADPEQLAQRFPDYFDKIVLDAPCSGEGMFRKDPNAITEWSVTNVEMCAIRQLTILPHAVAMLKAGGKLVYSTCTFAEEENERVIEALLERCKEMKLIRMERIWPHLHQGEGHFIAVLEKIDESQPNPPKIKKQNKKRKANRELDEAWHLFETFARTIIPHVKLPPGQPLLFGEQLYWLPSPGDHLHEASLFDGLKIMRPGLHLATCKKKRVEPAHALALASLTISAKPEVEDHPVVSLQPDDERLSAYLRGETIQSETSVHGWCLIAVESFPLGWGKAQAGQIKNHYPKGLRSW